MNLLPPFADIDPVVWHALHDSAIFAAVRIAPTWTDGNAMNEYQRVASMTHSISIRLGG